MVPPLVSVPGSVAPSGNLIYWSDRLHIWYRAGVWDGFGKYPTQKSTVGFFGVLGRGFGGETPKSQVILRWIEIYFPHH